MRRLLPAALLALAAVAVPAHADRCRELDKGGVRVGTCEWSDGCTGGWVDATPQIADDGLTVWVCAGRDGTYVCYATARQVHCTND